MGYDIEKEKREAIEAGRRALNSLSAVKENLNSAKNWGLVDMFGRIFQYDAETFKNGSGKTKNGSGKV